MKTKVSLKRAVERYQETQRKIREEIAKLVEEKRIESEKEETPPS